jgi:hypothetical protein
MGSILPPKNNGVATGRSKNKSPSQDRTAPLKKLQSHTTTKRLPWLDGKSSLASSPIDETSPPPRKPGAIFRVAASPSPKHPVSVRSADSVSPLSRHATLSTGTQTAHRSIGFSPKQRHSTISPTERRDSSNQVNEPVAGARAYTIRGMPIVRSASSPSRDLTSSRLSAVTHKPKKRLSIVRAEEPLDPSEQTRSRAESLAPVPNHLERFETPESMLRPVPRHVHMASPPKIIKLAEMSPTQPVPRHSTFERVSTRKLSNAIEGLEDLVQDAAIAVEDTADPRPMKEIYEIIKDARNAIQGASVDPASHLMEHSAPLEASSSSEEVTDFSSESSEGAGSPSFVAPVQKIQLGGTPPSRVHDSERRGSEAIDWAYRSSHNQPENMPSSSSGEDDSRGRSCFSSCSDTRLLPPNPAQIAPRDQIDLVLRPAQDYSRGRSPYRKINGSELGARRRRHRRGWRSDPDHSRSLPRRSHLPHGSSGLDSFDASFDEEDLRAAGKPNGIKRYGTELHVRDQAHHHTFSLQRRHRRQPIARNWRTSKKRLTALIACINTALLGIIVGIYAGTPSSWVYRV